MRECNQKFSVKKLLLTILCAVMISVFIGTTILFISALSGWMQMDALSGIDSESDTIKAVGSAYTESLNEIKEMLEDEKANYGEDYPAEELFLFYLITLFSSKNIVNMYALCFAMGIILGSLIYIVVIQNAKGKKLIIELIIAFIIIFLSIILLNFIYEIAINRIIKMIIEEVAIETETMQIEYSTYIYDLENNYIVIYYLVALAAIYIVNLIYQKILTYKLNKELNEKDKKH